MLPMAAHSANLFSGITDIRNYLKPVGTGKNWLVLYCMMSLIGVGHFFCSNNSASLPTMEQG